MPTADGVPPRGLPSSMTIQPTSFSFAAGSCIRKAGAEPLIVLGVRLRCGGSGPRSCDGAAVSWPAPFSLERADRKSIRCLHDRGAQPALDRGCENRGAERCEVERVSQRALAATSVLGVGEDRSLWPTAKRFCSPVDNRIARTMADASTNRPSSDKPYLMLRSSGPGGRVRHRSP